MRKLLITVVSLAIGSISFAQTSCPPATSNIENKSPRPALVFETNAGVMPPAASNVASVEGKTNTSGALNDGRGKRENLTNFVVADAPHFYTFIIAGVALLLTSITILLAIITGLGVSFFRKLTKEKEDILAAKKTLNTSYEEMISNMRLTALGATTVLYAKKDLSRLLAIRSSKKEVYDALNKTIGYPDMECLRLYAKSLGQFEDDIDIVRIVRNGIISYITVTQNVCNVTGAGTDNN